ncbi:lactate/malate family dehydrogenase [Gynuella sunshinyii]|uniref:Malate/lactate dehydrogenase n=1 Tax=Gynuella sunshinyii YC6258 TaxID=1445510 RepID=A0A0C5VTD5_9GAMM|nr:malate dehydrogenase [Gynuella sunshinyii]AJQ97947.1 malate/lactate dehydrogenase [Gynuella sunshinyii YC6258]
MKIGIIGAGMVGTSICDYVLTLGSCRELVLLDRNEDRARGELMDFGHTNALTFSKNTALKSGSDYALLADAEVVVITAGQQIKPGQSRLELAEVNSRICVDIARQIYQYSPNAILIVVTNPCDIAAYSIIANTPFQPHQVISSGCIIDTARLMKLVSDRVGVDPKNVFGYILGEHGSHCFMPWSLVSVAGQPIDYFCQQNGIEKIQPDQLLEEVRQVGYEIFRLKQNTSHGIAASVFRIIQAIEINEHSVLPVGVMPQGEYGLNDVVLSLPAVVNRNGIEKILIHPFTSEEQATLSAIASALSETLTDIGPL